MAYVENQRVPLYSLTPIISTENRTTWTPWAFTPGEQALWALWFCTSSSLTNCTDFELHIKKRGQAQGYFPEVARGGVPGLQMLPDASDMEFKHFNKIKARL